MKTISLIAIFLLSTTVVVAADIEIPVYPGSNIESRDSMQSSQPDVVMRDIQYRAPATTQQLLEFYQNSPYIKKCEENTMADNYICGLKAYKGITSGYLFIDRNTKAGKTEVYANYFCKNN